MRIMQGSPASPFLSSDSLVQYVFPFSVHMLSIMHDRVLQCLPGCSEISCNVKWNVYLAMEIPDCVSFISGQNSDDRVRSCEPNVFLA